MSFSILFKPCAHICH